MRLFRLVQNPIPDGRINKLSHQSQCHTLIIFRIFMLCDDDINGRRLNVIDLTTRRQCLEFRKNFLASKHVNKFESADLEF